MINFNMENAQLPLFYNPNFDNGSFSYKSIISQIEKGWEATIYEEKNTNEEMKNNVIPNLVIGKRYYKIINGSLTAFKVKSFSFCSVCRLMMFVDIVFPDGSVKCINVKNNFFFDIFESIEDYKLYKERKCEDYYVNRTMYLCDIFNEYIKKNQLINIRKNVFNTTFRVVSAKVYTLDKFTNATLDISKFKYLWIDEDGLHYSVFDEFYSKKYYPTEEKCVQSFKIIDFDDDESEEDVTISITLKIKSSQRKPIIDIIAKVGGIVE